MAIYGNDFIKWRVLFLVCLDRSKVPMGYPYGFFGLVGPFAIQYDFMEVE